jgi:spermidine synthase
VENLPQRWTFDELDLEFDLDEGEEGSRVVTWNQESISKDGGDHAAKNIRKELKRLYRFRNIEKQRCSDDIPQHECDLIWDYHQAVLDALTGALDSLPLEDVESAPDCQNGDESSEGVCVATNAADHYYDLAYEHDDLNYLQSCENLHQYEFEVYDVFDSIQTHYQLMTFHKDPNDGDVCMILDATLQICSNYRPHYHEFVVHFPARYVEKIRRVMFIGGGDSMLLHEILKYPTLEKVVGLELDQAVTRQSFKFFATEPHFDNDRVEWWFGDATRSLSLLPEDYWGSFDLVLVDLSETVLAMSVTEDLEIFDALALFLKPEGIMVKNELYMEKMNEVFDYTIQIFYESPKICRQVLTMGGNKVDFLHHKLQDHKVDTLIFRPSFEVYDKFKYIHDYRKNDARTDGKCEAAKNSNTTESSIQTQQSLGLLLVLEAENNKASLIPADLGERIESVAQTHGFTPITMLSYDSGVVVAILEEGYIMARPRPDQQYCGLDVHLWASFQKLNSLQIPLAELIGSEASFSSYRVVVGGMSGSTTTTTNDEQTMGPRVVPTRNCDTILPSDNKTGLKDIVVRAAMDEVVDLLADTKIQAAVLCGTREEDECLALDALEYNGLIEHVMTFWTCEGVEDESDDESTRIAKMIKCEMEILRFLETSLTAESANLDLFVVDGSASKAMIQIFSSIWSNFWNRQEWLSPHGVLCAWFSNDDDDDDDNHLLYTRHFLERYRKDQHFVPAARAELVLQTEDTHYELGIVATGDNGIFYALHVLERDLRAKLEQDATVEVRTIQGGKWYFDQMMNEKRFLPEDYDTKEDVQERFAQQVSLGRQTIFQLELLAGSATKIPSSEDIESYLEAAISNMKLQLAKPTHVSKVGDGAVMVSVFTEGSVILVWDGRQHVDINLFSSLNDGQKLADKFIGWFLEACHTRFKLFLRDDQPRGTGRVVNFSADKIYTPDFVQVIGMEAPDFVQAIGMEDECG